MERFALAAAVVLGFALTAAPKLNAHRVKIRLGGSGWHKIIAACRSAGTGYTVCARSQVGDQLSAKLTRHGYGMQQLAAIADIGRIFGHIGDFVRHRGKQLPQSVKGAAARSAEQYPAVMQAAYLVKYGARQLGLPLRQQSAVQIAGNQGVKLYHPEFFPFSIGQRRAM